MKAKLKIIQIAVMPCQPCDISSEHYNVNAASLYALCDDGSLWVMNGSRTCNWMPLPTIKVEKQAAQSPRNQHKG